MEEKQETYVKWKSDMETGAGPGIRLQCVPWAPPTQTLPSHFLFAFLLKVLEKAVVPAIKDRRGDAGQRWPHPPCAEQRE